MAKGATPEPPRLPSHISKVFLPTYACHYVQPAPQAGQRSRNSLPLDCRTASRVPDGKVSTGRRASDEGMSEERHTSEDIEDGGTE